MKQSKWNKNLVKGKKPFCNREDLMYHLKDPNLHYEEFVKSNLPFFEYFMIYKKSELKRNI